MTFADADELAIFMGKTFTERERAKADLVLELSTAAIVAEAGQSIEADTTTAVLTGVWDRDLELPERPVVAIASVAVNALPLNLGTDYYWNGGQKIRRGQPFGPSQSGDWYGDDDVEVDYALGSQGIPLAGASGFVPMTWGGPAAIVTVTYSHGRDPIPNLARLVCLSTADRFMSVPTGVVQETLGSYSVSYAQPHGALALSDAECKLVRRAFRKRAHSGY